MRKKPKPPHGTIVKGIITIEVFPDDEHGDVCVLAPGVSKGFDNWEDAMLYAYKQAQDYRHPRTAGMGLEVQIILHGDRER